VVAVEIDTELAAGLRRRFPEARVVEDDLLRVAFPRERFKVVAMPRNGRGSGAPSGKAFRVPHDPNPFKPVQ